MALAAPPSPFEYHIAISYAREDEAYVAQVAQVLQQNDALVFFDRSQDFLGTHLGIELFDVFLKKACYCLVFVSRHYVEKKYTQYEFSIILSRYIQDPGVLLPVRFDPTPLKGLDPGLYFDDLTQGTPPESLAKKILSKLTSVFPAEGSSRSYLDLEIPFVGRRSEIEEIEKLLGRESVKILVLYGQGGTGKTRLAWEIAKRLRGSFKDDMVFVELEPFRTTARVPAEIARCLGAREVEGVAIEKSLTEFLKPKHLLLVLDKFEHLSSAGRYLGELANQCPGLKILVTSRWPLADLGDMHSFPIPPMSLPTDGKKLTKKLARGSDAIELFRARAFQKRPDLDLDKYLHEVAQICWKLEGLAQAILLAASQLRRHEPAEILELLDLYLGGKPGGLNELEKAMHASIGWSYDLLPSTEQSLLRRLAIFSESFTPEAVYEVCGEGLSGDLREALELLSDRSLLQKEHGTTAAGVRFRMAEVIREYALERLRQREGEAAFRRRHAQEYARLVQAADRGLKTGERERWLKLLELERANFQSALEWCFSDHGDRELGSRLAGNLFWFWNFRAEFSEGRVWLEQALGDLSESRAKALYAAGGLAFLQGEYDQARSLLTASVRIWRKMLPERERDLGYALIILGMAALGKGDMDAALVAEQEALGIFERHARVDEWGLALALNDLGNVQRRRGELGEARRLYTESLAHWQKLNDVWGKPLTHSNLGFLLMLQNQFVEARDYFLAAQSAQKEVGDQWGLAETWKYMGDLEVRNGGFNRAGLLYRNSLELNRQIGRKQFMVGCLSGLFVVAAHTGRHRVAAALYGAARFLQDRWNVSPRICDEDQFEAALALLTPEVRLTEEFVRAQRDGERMEEEPDQKLERMTAFALEKFSPEPRRPLPARTVAPELSPVPEPKVRKAPRQRSGFPR